MKQQPTSLSHNFYIPSKFCKVTDRHRVSGKKKINIAEIVLIECYSMADSSSICQHSRKKTQLLLIGRHLVQLV